MRLLVVSLLVLCAVGCSAQSQSVVRETIEEGAVINDGSLTMGDLSFKSVGTEGDATLVQWSFTATNNSTMPQNLPVKVEFLNNEGRTLFVEKVDDPTKVTFAAGEARAFEGVSEIPTADAVQVVSVLVHVGQRK